MFRHYVPLLSEVAPFEYLYAPVVVVGMAIRAGKTPKEFSYRNLHNKDLSES